MVTRLMGIATANRAPRMTAGSRAASRGDRENEAEGRSALGVVLDPQLAAVRLDDAARDRQSHADAARLGAEERLEHALDVGGVDAGAAVGDAGLEPAARVAPHRHGDPAPLAAADR